jgi:hypothetical protein
MLSRWVGQACEVCFTAPIIVESQQTMQTNAHELTARQRVFVHTLATQGCTPARAAAAAGYPWSKDAALRLLKDEAIQAAVRSERVRYAVTELSSIATATLRIVMDDAGAPGSARVEAARTVMAMLDGLATTPQAGSICVSSGAHAARVLV